MRNDTDHSHSSGGSGLHRSLFAALGICWLGLLGWLGWLGWLGRWWRGNHPLHNIFKLDAGQSPINGASHTVIESQNDVGGKLFSSSCALNGCISLIENLRIWTITVQTAIALKVGRILLNSFPQHLRKWRLVKPITLGLNLINVPVAAMTEEQQKARLDAQVEKLRKERDEHWDKGESWPPSQVKYDQPFPVFTWIQTIVVVGIIAIVAVALVKFVLFWAFQ